MGLDSVQLITAIEAYVGISIPDREAEKISTVQDMVETVAKHLNNIGNSTTLRDQIFNRLCQALQKLQLTTNTSVLPTDYISQYLSPNKGETWQALIDALKLDVPKPTVFRSDSLKIMDKIKQALGFPPMYDWSSITIDQIVAVICARNIDLLISKRDINSYFEIYIIVMALTVQNIGLDYYEIAPEKSFTSDLGVD